MDREGWGLGGHWPSPLFPLGWAPHLVWLCGGPRCEGAHTFRAPRQPVELRDQHEQEVWVEAPSGTHAARHSQHLPKGPSGLRKKRPVRLWALRTESRDRASDT